MKRLILAISALTLALGLAPAMSAPLPNVIPNSCMIGGGATSAGEGTETCTFEAADVPAHGFVGATPNDFVIYVDNDGSGTPNAGDDILAEVSPTEGDQPGGQLDIEAGTEVTVQLFHGCAGGPACGWIGMLLVG